MRCHFKRTERLNADKCISAIYKSGKNGFCYPFRYAWLPNAGNDNVIPCQVLIAVPKRRFPLAVHRNLIRRRVREAYRKNKNILYDSLKKNSLSLSLIITYVAVSIEAYPDIERKLIVLLRHLIKEVKNP